MSMRPGEKVLAAPEELGLDSRTAFRRAATELLEQLQEGAGRLIIDLAGTRQIDSAGLGALMLIQRKAGGEDPHILAQLWRPHPSAHGVKCCSSRTSRRCGGPTSDFSPTATTWPSPRAGPRLAVSWTSSTPKCWCSISACPTPMVSPSCKRSGGHNPRFP